jgi:hypothetical protein
MAWKPVFSPNSQYVASKVEINGKYTIAVNDCLWKRACDACWEPVFSPCGEKILCRTIENGICYRRVIPVKDIVR